MNPGSVGRVVSGPTTPSSAIPRSFLIGVFAGGILIAAVVAVLGFYGYLGAGILP